MNAIERAIHDIVTLLESIKLDNEDIRNLNLTGSALQGVLEHIGWCMTELDSLKKRLDDEENANRS